MRARMKKDAEGGLKGLSYGSFNLISREEAFLCLNLDRNEFVFFPLLHDEITLGIGNLEQS